MKTRPYVQVGRPGLWFEGSEQDSNGTLSVKPLRETSWRRLLVAKPDGAAIALFIIESPPDGPYIGLTDVLIPALALFGLAGSCNRENRVIL